MTEKQLKFWLTVWTILSCALMITAMLVVVFIWGNRAFYITLMLIGLILASLRIVISAVIALLSSKGGKTPFAIFNIKQGKICFCVVLVIQMLNMMFIHI